jgi:hypothetical protein
VAFVLSTWFGDCMPVAPILYLFGPDSAVSQLFRLLGCLCRRPILLGDIDLAGLATLPNQVGATLLINQRDLGRRVRRILLASNRRHFCMVRGSGHLHLYGAKAFSCEDFPMHQPGLRVTLSPAQDPLPCLTDSEVQDVAQSFQASLLHSRMSYYEEVRGNRVDCSAFVPEMREQASTWLGPIVDCPELCKAVFREILHQSEDAAGARFFDPKCVVVEASLVFCHKPDTEFFFVGELAEIVNAILASRHEASKLSDKKVGLVLADLGIYGKRETRGYKIRLTDIVRKRVHQLVSDYRVPTLDDGVRRCDLCKGENAASE